VCAREHGCTADSAAVVALVTGVGRHGDLPGTYWSGERLSHLFEHLPYRLSALVDLRGYMIRQIRSLAHGRRCLEMNPA
jgi:hypothetical protein